MRPEVATASQRLLGIEPSLVAPQLAQPLAYLEVSAPAEARLLCQVAANSTAHLRISDSIVNFCSTVVTVQLNHT